MTRAAVASITGWIANLENLNAKNWRKKQVGHLLQFVKRQKYVACDGGPT